MDNEFVVHATMPSGRFFKPTEEFWQTMEKLGTGLKFVDCGAWEGHVTEEALRRGFKIIGVDICSRDNQNDLVMHVDAVTFPWRANVIPLICRPDHGGWCGATIEAAFDAGSQFAIYVGLEKNLEVDLDEYLDYYLRGSKVGAEGERLYIIDNL